MFATNSYYQTADVCLIDILPNSHIADFIEDHPFTFNQNTNGQQSDHNKGCTKALGGSNQAELHRCQTHRSAVPMATDWEDGQHSVDAHQVRVKKHFGIKSIFYIEFNVICFIHINKDDSVSRRTWWTRFMVCRLCAILRFYRLEEITSRAYRDW